MARTKPNFNAECERCIRAAKGLAAREGALRLDPVHVVAAAVALEPEAASEVLTQLGADAKQARVLAARYGVAPDASAAPKAMHLVPELREVVYGDSLTAEEHAGEVDVAAFLKALLRHPSYRLKRFLVQVVCEAKEDQAAMKPDADVHPYGSFRDYLADRQRLWALRGKAADGVCRRLGAREHSRKPSYAYGDTGLLDTVMRLEHKLARRYQVTPVGKLATRSLAKSEGLTELQTELVEGVFLSDVYGLGEPWEDALTVRTFAQMLAPDVYPRNCADVLSSCDDLVKRDVLGVGHDSLGCRLGSRLRLTSNVQDDLLDALSRDGVTDGDLRALHRHLESDGYGSDDAITG